MQNGQKPEPLRTRLRVRGVSGFLLAKEERCEGQLKIKNEKLKIVEPLRGEFNIQSSRTARYHNF
jgi:hypothetical protein